jgi:hypothetical protein
MTSEVFPQVHQQAFVPTPGADIFQVFDEVELAWYYRQWQNME